MAVQNLVIADSGQVEVGSAPGDGSSGSPSVVDLTINATVTGTTFEVVGAVYLNAGTIVAAASFALLGSDTADAELEIRSLDGATLLTTISNTGAIASASPSSDINVATAGWYNLRLRDTNAGGTATVRGLHLAYVGGSPAEYHGTTLSPVGSWNLDGDLTAEAGNAVSVASGTELYTPGPVLGGLAFSFNGSRLNQSHDANLQITGAVSFGCLINMARPETAARTVMAFGGSGTAEANNYLWRTRVNNANRISYSHENSGGNLNTFTSDYTLPVGQWVHLFWVRQANGTDVELYINGVSRDSGTLGNAPTGGSTSQLGLGGDPTADGQNILAQIASPVVYASALTAAQVLSLARLTLPPELRT